MISKWNYAVFALKNKLANREGWKSYKEAMAYDRSTKEEKIEQSWTARRQIVEHAYEHCAFYRKYYDAKGFHPSMLIEEKDWELVPVLEKSMIRKYSTEIIADDADMCDLRRGSTGGSTGKPMEFYKSRRVHIDALHWRSLAWWGVAPSDNEGILHRRVPTALLAKIKNRLMWWPTKRAYLSAKKITDEDVRKFVADLRSKKIVWLQGYCAALEHVSDYLNNNNIEGRLNLKLVWSTSAVLTPAVRERMESVFGCNVMDQYGCCEMGNIAVQKPGADRLTIHSDYVHVDIVDDESHLLNDNHEEGDILITDLLTHEFPMIKYRLGDRSRILQTMKESDDGYPTLDFVKGRISDNIVLPNGEIVSGNYLSASLTSFADVISSYQVYQHVDYSVDLKVVFADGITTDDKRIIEMVDGMCSLFNDSGIEMRVLFVPDIPDDAGKRRYIISEVALREYNNQYSQIKEKG